MNIIPLVTAFILIITLFMSTQLQTASTLVKEAKLFTTKQALLTELRRDMFYQKCNKESSSRRESSFNLTPFVNHGVNNKAFPPFIETLSKLYPDYKKELLESLMDNLITTLKEQGTLNYNLKLKNPAHQPLFLELITGPNGSPPLLEVCHSSKEVSDKFFTAYTLKTEFLYTFCGPEEGSSIHSARKNKKSVKQKIEYLGDEIGRKQEKNHPTAVHGFQDKTTGIRLGRYEPY